MVASDSRDSDRPPADELPEHGAFMYASQFDSTSQRIRAVSTRRANMAKLRYAQTLEHILMQGGFVVSVRFKGAAVTAVSKAPYLVGACVLQGHNTNDLLEAVLPRMPLPLEELWTMRSLVAGVGGMMNIQFCLDRASVNFRACRYIWKLAQDWMGVIMFHEPCNAHGIPLSNSRSSYGKTSGVALCSLSKIFRDAGSLEQLTDALMAEVGDERIIVVHGCMP